MRIGIFDSGVGGLTVYHELKRAFPTATFYYLGDTARLPYGTKSVRAIQQYSAECIHFLSSFQVDCMVVACNTASAVAWEVVQRESSVPVIGMVEPPSQKSAAYLKNGSIAVLGTEATIRSRAYQLRLELLGFENIYGVSCPLFVPLVEEGIVSGALVDEALKHYLAPLLEKNLDAVILGCTHYPVLEKALRAFFPPSVHIIASSRAAAEVLTEIPFPATTPPGSGESYFYVTDDPSRFLRVAEVILGEEIASIQRVELPVRG